MRVLELLQHDSREVLLLDISDLPYRASLVAAYSQSGLDRLEYLGNGRGSVPLNRVRSVWWRRPQVPDLLSIPDDNVRAFTYNEWQEATNGLWQLIDAPWMNPPARDEVAGRKLLQLKIAAELGLRIPRTLVTSDPDQARSFIAELGVERTVFKTFSCTHEIWRETRLVGRQELDLLDSVRLAPVIFQEYIPADADLRITLVGESIFPAAIHNRETDYPVDFRMSLGQALTEATELPPEVERKLHALMKCLGLVYGAVDMRRTPKGEHVFLEINTAGEFLFVEERTDLPISSAVADWLVRPASG